MKSRLSFYAPFFACWAVSAVAVRTLAWYSGGRGEEWLAGSVVMGHLFAWVLMLFEAIRREE